MNMFRTFFHSALALTLFLGFFSAVFLAPTHALNPKEVIGQIEEPPGTEIYNQQVSGEIALLYFISNLLRVATILAGLWVLVNVFYAGFIYMTGNGDAQSHTKISQLLFQSVMGLLLITTSYTLAALIGLLVFGDPTYIINPQF